MLKLRCHHYPHHPQLYLNTWCPYSTTVICCVGNSSGFTNILADLESTSVTRSSGNPRSMWKTAVVSWDKKLSNPTNTAFIAPKPRSTWKTALVLWDKKMSNPTITAFIAQKYRSIWKTALDLQDKKIVKSHKHRSTWKTVLVLQEKICQILQNSISITFCCQWYYLVEPLPPKLYSFLLLLLLLLILPIIVVWRCCCHPPPCRCPCFLLQRKNISRQQDEEGHCRCIRSWSHSSKQRRQLLVLLLLTNCATFEIPVAAATKKQRNQQEPVIWYNVI